MCYSHSKEEKSYEFTIANSVDEITPKIVNKEIDIAAVPANLASVLYNNTNVVKVFLTILSKDILERLKR